MPPKKVAVEGAKKSISKPRVKWPFPRATLEQAFYRFFVLKTELGGDAPAATEWSELASSLTTLRLSAAIHETSPCKHPCKYAHHTHQARPKVIQITNQVLLALYASH